MHIPCCVPRLPTLDALREYLVRIDERRWYSNFGPLSAELDERLGRCFGDPDAVATVANGTLGIQLVLSALVEAPGVCLLPSWTFVATGHAARGAGLSLRFVDVDPATGVLDVARCRELALAGDVRAVVVVSPFGRPVDLAPWRAFREETQCAVVVDAAAGFDSIRASDVPSVLSLHATKILPAGEGGAVVTTSTALVEAVRKRSNFGFYGSRVAQVEGTNAKLSEYHAAVALASLDGWAERRERLSRLAEAYRARLPEGVVADEGWGTEWLTGTCPVRIHGRDAHEVEADLARAGVEARRWWGDGLHAHPAFADTPADALPNTAALARSSLGLPFFEDLTLDQVELVTRALARAL